MGIPPRVQRPSYHRIVLPLVRRVRIWGTLSVLRCNQVPSVPRLAPLLVTSAGGSAEATVRAQAVGFVHQDLAAATCLTAEVICPTAAATYPTAEIVLARAIGLGSAIALRLETSPNRLLGSSDRYQVVEIGPPRCRVI